MRKNFFTTLCLSILTLLLAACLLFPNPVHASEPTTGEILMLGPGFSYHGASVQHLSQSFVASLSWSGYSTNQKYTVQEIQDYGKLTLDVLAANNDKGQKARLLNKSSINLKGLHLSTYRISSPQIPRANLPHAGRNYIYVRVTMEIKGNTLKSCAKIAGTVDRY